MWSVRPTVTAPHKTKACGLSAAGFVDGLGMEPGGLLRAGRRCRCRRRRRCGCTGSGFGRMHGICAVFFTTHVGLVARRDDHVHRQRSKQDEANNNLPHINISWDGFVQSRGLARDAVHDSSRRMHLRLGRSAALQNLAIAAAIAAFCALQPIPIRSAHLPLESCTASPGLWVVLVRGQAP